MLKLCVLCISFHGLSKNFRSAESFTSGSLEAEWKNFKKASEGICTSPMDLEKHRSGTRLVLGPKALD